MTGWGDFREIGDSFTEAIDLLIAVGEVQMDQGEVMLQAPLTLDERNSPQECLDCLVVPAEGSLDLAKILQRVGADLRHHDRGIRIVRQIVRDRHRELRERE